MLDLYCKAGGAAVGYYKAGFSVVGIDHEPQKNYPFKFFQRDAIQFLEECCAECGDPEFDACGLHSMYDSSSGEHGHAFVAAADYFDAVHASPPCQPFTALRSVFDSTKYADLIEPTRRVLKRCGLPYIMENVVGSPLRRDLILCAAPFGLRSYRHRIFECNFPVEQPSHPKHVVRVNRRKKNRRGHWDAGGFVTVVGDIGSYVGPEAMGIDWMTGNELSQAIPPAYTEFIGRQLMTYLKGK